MNATVLELSNIHFQRESRDILHSISWSVARGEIAAIVGANGSGKSTLIRMICGYLWPTKGSVRLLNQTLGEYPVAKLRQRVGLVEATAVYPFDEQMTALDVVCSGYFAALTLGYVEPTQEQWQHSQQCLAKVGLGARRDQLYRTMSTGERMRCLIARALVRRPELLLLDEPTAGLDLPAREQILGTLAHITNPKNPNTPAPPSLVMVTHHLEELLPATTNILLLSRDGRTVAHGPPEHVLTNAHMTAAYGIPVSVERRNGRWHAHVDPGSWHLEES